MKPMLRGVTPKGTREAVREEMHSIIADAQGPVGARKRANAGRIARMLKKAWCEDGQAVQDLQMFAKTYCARP